MLVYYLIPKEQTERYIVQASLPACSFATGEIKDIYSWMLYSVLQLLHGYSDSMSRSMEAPVGGIQAATVVVDLLILVSSSISDSSYMDTITSGLQDGIFTIITVQLIGISVLTLPGDVIRI